jgi:hypothetical protein
MARNLNLIGDYGAKTAKTGLEPPRELGSHGLSLWNRVQAEYSIRDAGGVEILCQVCQAVDRAEELAAAIKADGIMVQTKFTRRANPAIREEIQCRAFIVRALKELGLSTEAVKSIGRPPNTGGWIPPGQR